MAMNPQRYDIYSQAIDTLARSIAESVVAGVRTAIQQTGDRIMAGLQDIRDAVERSSTVEQGMEQVMQNISQQLRDLIAAGTPSQAEIQAIVDNIDAETQRMAAAVAANTPAAP